MNISLSFYKEEWGVWVPIPCYEGIGSCTLPTNGCDLLAKQQKHLCPILKSYGLPCAYDLICKFGCAAADYKIRCPIAPGKYSTPAGGVQITTKDPGLSWLTDGDLEIKVSLNTASGVYFCLDVTASVKSVDA